MQHALDLWAQSMHFMIVAAAIVNGGRELNTSQQPT